MDLHKISIKRFGKVEIDVTENIKTNVKINGKKHTFLYQIIKHEFKSF